MDRFNGGSNNLYEGEFNNIDTIKDTKDIFKKDKSDKQEKKTTNSYILSTDLTRVLKKNRELYNFIEILENQKKELESENKKLQDKIKKLEKNNK